MSGKVLRMTDPDPHQQAVEQQKTRYDTAGEVYATEQRKLIAAVVAALKAGCDQADVLKWSGFSDRYLRLIKAEHGLPKGKPGAKPGHRPAPRKAR